MKAVLCKQFGPPESLVVEDIASPAPGPGEVVITVKASGVNFPDTLIIENKYQTKPPLPFSPGCEVAGIVKQLGLGVERFAVGDRVIAFPGWGGFAEEVAVAEDRVVPIPEAIDFVTAAGFMLVYGTSYHALVDRANLQPGESLLVLGAAGGVGLAAIEIGKALGASVIAAASTAEKLALCRQHGADELINYSEDNLRDRMKELSPSGVDVVYDPVGGAFTEPALRSMAWGGRFLVVGFAAGDIPQIPLNLTLLKGCSIVGVFWGSFTRREAARNQANMQHLLEWLEAGLLKPHVYATLPLAQAPQALRYLLSRQVMGKVVLGI